MNRAFSSLLCASLVLWTRFGFAASPNATPAPSAGPDKAACLDASSQAQNLRDAHKLLEARQKLRICAQQTCPAVVARDCLTWLDAVEQSLPTVVISAKDGGGHDLFDVKVTADGQPFATRLAGDAVAMDPGPHAFRFEAADGSALEQQVLVREGLKNQNVAVVLGTVAPPPARDAKLQSNPGGKPDRLTPVDREGPFPWRTVGWISGGIGIAGLAVATVFGFMAISDRSSAHCDASGACDAGPLNDANTAATVSTIGFVAGGVLLAGGAALVLFGPSAGASGSVAPAGSWLKLAPIGSARDAGLILGGSW